jgi:hypothetical protein
MLIVASPGVVWRMRVPQSAQNMHSSTLPLSVGRLQLLRWPCVSMNASVGTMTEMPKAEADCLRHSRQWHT